MTISDSINTFLNSLWDSAQTQATYKTGLRRFQEFLEEKFGRAVSTDDLYNHVLREFDAWLGEQNVVQSSRNTYIAGVSAWLAEAKINRQLPASFEFDTAILMRKKTVKRSGYKIPDIDRIQHIPKLVAYLSNMPIPDGSGVRGKEKRLVALRNRAFAWFLYATACRQSEARLLKRKALGGGGTSNYNTHIKIVGKGDKSRILLFQSPSARRAMAEYLNERTDTSEYIFVSHERDTNQPITRVTAWRIYDDVSKALGTHLSPHDTRHYAAQYWINDGMPLEAVQKILGHSSPAITSMIYAPMNTKRMTEWADKSPLPVPQ